MELYVYTVLTANLLLQQNTRRSKPLFFYILARITEKKVMNGYGAILAIKKSDHFQYRKALKFHKIPSVAR